MNPKDADSVALIAELQYVLDMLDMALARPHTKRQSNQIHHRLNQAAVTFRSLELLHQPTPEDRRLKEAPVTYQAD